jgi:eukaryotic-like serine/threonine-protein kinase
MTPELYERLKPLYAAALDIPEERRAAFVARACGDERGLREELEALLKANDERTATLGAPFIGLEVLLARPERAFAVDSLLLSRFKIVRLLGWGGMGEVYEVEDRFLHGVHVALKTLLPKVAHNPELRKSFEREVLLAREVSHPNLCPIYDIFHCEGPAPGFLFLTMKLLPGKTLATRLQEPPPMTSEERLAVLRQTCLGTAAIHAAGIIHRDIKPNNMMVDGGGSDLRLWITDFGLARAYHAESTVSSIGTVAGTPGYIAPELFLGHPPSHASDLYALGVVLHEVFAGQKPTPVPGTHSCSISPQLTTPRVPALGVRIITECLQDDPQRRCAAFAHALEIIDPRLVRNYDSSQSKQFWTRRRFSGVAVAGVCAIAAGTWWKRDDIKGIVEDVLEPLPDKRYVALMAWPTSDSAAVVSTVLDAIGQRLARAEAFVKNLLIIKLNDLPGQSGSPVTPAESVTALGANLVLAASLQSTPTKIWLTLRVLHAVSQHVVRSARVWCAPAALSSIADKASETAARLLGLPIRETDMQDTEELHRISPETFKVFSEAEQLVSQPNDTGLDAAVLKYQLALSTDPHFALGYARLAMAYTKQFLADHEPAKLKLAQSNATLSLRYNPSSAKGQLSQAMIFLYSGKTTEALDYFARSLKADPGNPETLLYKAQTLRDARQWPQAEQVYRDIAAERPNYWLAHNELGWILFRQAKYQQAADEFDAAATAAPQVAMPLANLGMIYLELGKRDEAIKASQRSIERSPNEDAYLTLGDIAFSDQNYRSSLDNYQRAAALNPNAHLIWRNIGDCYAMLGDPGQVRKNYAKATQLLAATLATNPRSGSDWATLAFYHAKIGDTVNAQADLRNAGIQGATDVESQFMVTQALALLGRKQEALNLLLSCMDKGLSTVEVDLALDLKDIRKDPRYLLHVSKLRAQKPSRVSEAAPRVWSTREYNATRKDESLCPDVTAVA